MNIYSTFLSVFAYTVRAAESIDQHDIETQILTNEDVYSLLDQCEDQRIEDNLGHFHDAIDTTLRERLEVSSLTTKELVEIFRELCEQGKIILRSFITSADTENVVKIYSIQKIVTNAMRLLFKSLIEGANKHAWSEIEHGIKDQKRKFDDAILADQEFVAFNELCVKTLTDIYHLFHKMNSNPFNASLNRNGSINNREGHLQRKLCEEKYYNYVIKKANNAQATNRSSVTENASQGDARKLLVEQSCSETASKQENGMSDAAKLPYIVSIRCKPNPLQLTKEVCKQESTKETEETCTGKRGVTFYQDDKTGNNDEYRYTVTASTERDNGYDEVEFGNQILEKTCETSCQSAIPGTDLCDYTLIASSSIYDDSFSSDTSSESDIDVLNTQQ